MIKFHPGREMLNDHIAAKLPLSLTLAVSAHIEMCAQCQAAVQRLESQQAEKLWQQTANEPVDFGDMLQDILAEQPQTQINFTRKPETTIQVGRKAYQLPAAFSIFTDLKWSRFAALSRARLVSNEQEVHGSLLHIEKGGAIPRHQHKGYELTLLLEGEFADENGSYHKGDLICLAEGDEHRPFTNSGCLCYVVQNAPVHFVTGVSKVFNPLARLLY